MVIKGKFVHLFHLLGFVVLLKEQKIAEMYGSTAFSFFFKKKKEFVVVQWREKFSMGVNTFTSGYTPIDKC